MQRDKSQRGNKKGAENVEMNQGRWSTEQQQLFVEGMRSYGRNWKKIQSIVRTRTGSQIRSHSQKFIEKLKKEAKNPKTRERAKILMDQLRLDQPRQSSPDRPRKGGRPRNQMDVEEQKPFQVKLPPSSELANIAVPTALNGLDHISEADSFYSSSNMSEAPVIPQLFPNSINQAVLRNPSQIWRLGSVLLQINFIDTFVGLDNLRRSVRDPSTRNTCNPPTAVAAQKETEPKKQNNKPPKTKC